MITSVVARGPRQQIVGAAITPVVVPALGSVRVSSTAMIIITAGAKRVRIWNFTASFGASAATDSGLLTVVGGNLTVQPVDSAGLGLPSGTQLPVSGVPVGQPLRSGFQNQFVYPLAYFDLLDSDYQQLPARRGFAFFGSVLVFNTDGAVARSVSSIQGIVQYELDPPVN